MKREQVLTIKCTAAERFIIKGKAEMANLTASDYLRQLGVTGKIDSRQKALPGEVLRLTGTLNHMAANLNQIAKKRNTMEELNALERATLQVQSQDLKKLALTIKNYLQ